MSDQEDICAILRSEFTRGIDFKIEQSFWIRRASFEGVANAVQSGTIIVLREELGARVALYRSQVDSQGRPGDAFVVPIGCVLRGRDATDMEAVIVHEAVHAWCDMQRAVGTSRLTGEAAAYIAQTLYAYNRGSELQGGSEDEEPIFAQARDLVQIRRMHQFPDETTELERCDIHDLRVAIANCALYTARSREETSPQFDGVGSFRHGCMTCGRSAG